jgi:hypothetical protein
MSDLRIRTMRPDEIATAVDWAAAEALFGLGSLSQNASSHFITRTRARSAFRPREIRILAAGCSISTQGGAFA